MVGIILACGESKRMGEDKLLLHFEGKTIIEHVLEKAIRSNLGKVMLVCRDKEVEIQGRALGATVLLNNKYYLGQSQSIKVALNYIDITEDVMFLVGDIPLIKTETINMLISIHGEKQGIVVTRNNGKNSNPVVFSANFRNELMEIQGDIGGREIIKRHENEVTYYDVIDEKELMDIDTPEEYLNLINRY